MSLILIPTPLQDDHPLEPIALEKLKADCLDENTILLVEEHKVGRQRWLKWGLPREAIEKFQLYLLLLLSYIEHRHETCRERLTNPVDHFL